MTPREWRIKSGLTQTELAQQLGIVQATISEVERGVKAPSGYLLTKYFSASNGMVTPNDFLPQSGDAP